MTTKTHDRVEELERENDRLRAELARVTETCGKKHEELERFKAAYGGLIFAYPRLIEPTRELLRTTGLPWVIENVEGAPLVDPIVLCGTMFPGLRVLRHRLFESSVPLVAPPHGSHPLVFTHDKRKAHYGTLNQDESFVQVTGGGNCTVRNAKLAMGIDWMTKDEMNEAIPPAYTEYVGHQLRAALLTTRKAA